MGYHKGIRVEPKGKFGNWLSEKIRQFRNGDLTCCEVADWLHCSRQLISAHIQMKSKPQYVYILAYCNYFGGNPDDIWKLVEEDWG